jgi:hypothetical protein
MNIRKNFPIWAILGFYILCILAADPRGEFPLNDDWSYVRSAFSFGSGRGMHVDEWSAPSLVGQAFYGGLLARLFSPRFDVLRLSTLFLSCCTAALLWGIFSRLKIRKGLASVLLLTWIFNPLQFNLSFTFMTEIPFLFFAALAIYFYVLYLDGGKTFVLVLAAAALGYAFLIRQTAIIFILALICSILLDLQTPMKKRIRQAALAALAAGAFVAGYYWWVISGGGVTAAVHRKFDLLQHLTSEQLIGNSYGIFFYLAFIIFPPLLVLIPSRHRAPWNLNKKLAISVLVAWSAIALVGIGWFYGHSNPEYLPSTTYHEKMPFLLNVLYDSGLGPITLDPAYFGPCPTPIHIRVWQAVTALVALGAVWMGSICVFGLLRVRTIQKSRRPLLSFAGLAFTGIVFFEVLFSHLQEGGLFDRHIVIAALPFYLLLILFTGVNDRENGAVNTISFSAAGIGLAAFMAFSVAANHDYMEWNRIRWEMGRNLLAGGVDPLSIVGGFEFNAWYNYDTFLARGNISKVRQWWYDRRDYLISMTPQDGYEIKQKKSYYSWVHLRPISIYLLRGTDNDKQ